jgi:hypothetical protein
MYSIECWTAPTELSELRSSLFVALYGESSVPRRAGPRPPGAGGLGLRIVDELVGDLGWYADATSKHVWAEFPIPSAGSRATLAHEGRRPEIVCAGTMVGAGASR